MRLVGNGHSIGCPNGRAAGHGGPAGNRSTYGGAAHLTSRDGSAYGHPQHRV